MIESLKKNRKGILLMVASSVCACIGQLLWKLSVENGIYIMLIGFVFYCFGAIFMLSAYKFGSLSVLQPILSVNYIFSVILGSIILSEPVTFYKVIGVLIITAGVIFVGGGDD